VEDLENQRSPFETAIGDGLVELLEFVVAHLFLCGSTPKPSS